jgi:hypothetical protein
MIDGPKIKSADIRRPMRLRGIALPNEHGAWGMLFEPLVAATAIAFSVTAIWISLAVIAAFLIRQPLKVLMITRKAGRTMPQAEFASKFFFYYSAVFAVGAAGTLVTAPAVSFLPLIISVPLAAVPIYYDAVGKSRNLAPELAGAAAITSSAAVIALAGGWPITSALSLWVILACRWIPSILYVRSRLLLEKGKPFPIALPVALSAAAVIVTGALAYYDLGPRGVVLVMAILLVRSAIGLSPYSKRRKAMQIGVLEVIFGSITVAAIIAGYLLGL